MAIRADRRTRNLLNRLGVELPLAIPRQVARIPGRMNATESRYADHLEGCRLAGEIVAWAYEPGPLILSQAARCSYLPDFIVTLGDGTEEYHEVKGGHIWEDSLVKLKWAASVYPDHPFRLCQYHHQRWQIRIIPHD